MIDPNFLEVGPHQPRETINERDIQSLAHSIHYRGVLEPILVRELGQKRYEILAGERRWRAAQKIHLSCIPCLVSDWSDEAAASIPLVENLQRKRMTSTESARAIQRLIDQFGYSHEHIATLIGWRRSTVTHVLRILGLPASILEKVDDGVLSLGHAKVLLSAPSHVREEIVQACCAENWSVHKLSHKIAKRRGARSPEPLSTGSRHSWDYVLLRSGTPEFIGYLKIGYRTDDELQVLLEKLT